MADTTNIQQYLSLLEKYNTADRKEKISTLSLSNNIDALISMSENKPLYQLNLLEIANVIETMTSEIIFLILKYKEDNSYILCRSFLEQLLVPLGFKMKWFKSPQITAETNRLDICIQELGKYAIIIENKLKGAVFQRNQLARYIGKMRQCGYKDNQIFIIILPNHIDKQLFSHINKSVWRLPKDWTLPNHDRACAYNDKVSCKCDFNIPFVFCRDCEKDLYEKFSNRTSILDIELLDWFEDFCIPSIPIKEEVLRSAVIQFVDFLKGLFNKRLNSKILMEIVDFLREQLLDSKSTPLEQWELVEKKKKEVENLSTGLIGLQTSISQELIEEWRKQLERKWGKWLRHENRKSFGIKIKGIWCGCWCESREPYWGFQCDSPTGEQIEIVQKILENCGKTICNQQKGWISWEHTLHGDERCEEFYNSAKELGYIE